MNAKTTKKTMNNLQTKPATKYPTGTQEIETNDNEASQHKTKISQNKHINNQKPSNKNE